MNAYDEQLSEFFISPEEYEAFELALPDDKLHKMIVQSLEKDIDFWNQKPWDLREVDKDNLKFFLGDQWEATSKAFLGGNQTMENGEIDNRLFAGVRAILSYATGQLGVPEIIPSGPEDYKQTAARNLAQVLYQHSKDEGMEAKLRATILNLLIRKRGWLKMRFDPYAGIYGDIVTEVVDPADVVLDRTARFHKDPNKQYHRVRCTLDELIGRYPNKKDAIYKIFNVRKGVFTQLSQLVTYYECWFTYLDSSFYPRQAVASFVHEPGELLLEKIPNPNWIYTGDDLQDKLANITERPPKPFVGFNYLNFGLSAVDETCLFDQAKPEQIRLNKRLRQWHKNIDYVNGRWVADKNAMEESVAKGLVNKGSKTVAMVDASQAGGDVGKAFKNISATPQPQEVYLSIQDSRSEIDQLIGVPAIFRGAQPSSKSTLGRDMLINQQAGNLQDDLIRAVHLGTEVMYTMKAQFMRVYFTEDHQFQSKGPAGNYDFLTLSGENMDTGVKIGVQVDSNLPLDKDKIRDVATELLKIGKIDYLTAMQDMGLPNPEIRAERYMKSVNDPVGYLQSIEQEEANDGAEMDIQSLIRGKDPQEDREYTEEYLNYFNEFVASQRFQSLVASNPEAAQKVIAFLAIVQEELTKTANLRGSMLDPAGMIPTPGPYMQAPQTGATPPGAPGGQPGGQPSPPGGTNPGNPGSAPGMDRNQGQGDQKGQESHATPTMGDMRKQTNQQSGQSTGINPSV